jgi:hypothetical protein
MTTECRNFNSNDKHKRGRSSAVAIKTPSSKVFLCLNAAGRRFDVAGKRRPRGPSKAAVRRRCTCVCVVAKPRVDFVSCGGGGSTSNSTGGGSAGTTPGNYMVTVIASGGSGSQQQTTLALTIQ